MEKGWIKLHRAVRENHFLMKDNTARLLFMDLLVAAGNNKGQIAGGRTQLAKQFNLKPMTFYKAMNRLCKENMVNISSNSRYTVYTICKWHLYQSTGEQVEGLHGNSRGTAGEHSKENKNKNITYVKLLLNELMEILGQANAKVLPERTMKLKTRLKTFNADELRKAAANLTADSYMQGYNPAGKKWGTVDYLLRSDGNVDKYLALSSSKSPPSAITKKLEEYNANR